MWLHLGYWIKLWFKESSLKINKYHTDLITGIIYRLLRQMLMKAFENRFWIEQRWNFKSVEWGLAATVLESQAYGMLACYTALLRCASSTDSQCQSHSSQPPLPTFPNSLSLRTSLSPFPNCSVFLPQICLYFSEIIVFSQAHNLPAFSTQKWMLAQTFLVDDW